MTFKESLKICLGPKYLFKFAGRASRSEFWWFMLFILLINLVTSFIIYLLPPMLAGSISLVVSLLLLPANLGVTVRRFHDRNLSGWWLLIPISMFVYWMLTGASNQAANPVNSMLMLAMSAGYLLILCLPGTNGPNKYGAAPGAAS